MVINLRRERLRSFQIWTIIQFFCFVLGTWVSNFCWKQNEQHNAVFCRSECDVNIYRSIGITIFFNAFYIRTRNGREKKRWRENWIYFSIIADWWALSGGAESYCVGKCSLSEKWRVVASISQPLLHFLDEKFSSLIFFIIESNSNKRSNGRFLFGDLGWVYLRLSIY